MIVGKSLKLRPVAPGPPQNSVSPLNNTGAAIGAGDGRVEAATAGAVSRGVEHPELGTTGSDHVALGQRGVR